MVCDDDIDFADFDQWDSGDEEIAETARQLAALGDSGIGPLTLRPLRD